MIAQEYAKALFELASDNAERIDEELSIICDAFSENPDSIKVLEAPNIKESNKKEIINSITAECNELLRRFLLVLVDNDRYASIFDIKNEYHDLVSNKKKVVEVDVTSKNNLSNDQIKTLKKTLSPKFGGSEIVINNIVDSALIGGIKVVAEGKLIDLSIRGKISSLKESL